MEINAATRLLAAHDFEIKFIEKRLRDQLSKAGVAELEGKLAHDVVHDMEKRGELSGYTVRSEKNAKSKLITYVEKA